MKRHLAPALFSLSLCAVMGGVRVAGAQTVDGSVQPVADSTMVIIDAPLAPGAVTTVIAPVAPSGAPFMMPATGVRPGSPILDVQSEVPAVLPPMVDWKMPTSRALMIGGAATALIGVAVIGHDTGAIIALTGTAVAVYGLYLHYNR